MIEFNKYQSSIQELHLEQYPKEVQDDFYEAITSIPYIVNLIRPDRPYAKDAPRDENGRAILDLADPYIVENVDYFRPIALYYKKTGRLTNLKPNPNPNSQFGKWIKDELSRIWHGYTRPEDGAYVTGDMYWYLNYCPIIKSKIRKGSKIGDRVIDFPEFWEGVLWRSIYYDMARENGHHSAEIARRGASKSYFVASILSKLFECGENEDTCEKVRGMVTAYQKEFLNRDGTLNKFVEMIDFQEQFNIFPNYRIKSSIQDMSWKKGFIDNDSKAEKGVLNEVIGVSAKDDPDKLRGKRSSRIIIEEFGNFAQLSDTYRVMLPSVQEGDVVFGEMILIGTGGSEGSDFAGAREIIYNPKGFNIQPVKNVYDKSNQGKSESIFFFGAPINRADCYNSDGISDVTKAVLEICYNRYLVKYNTTDAMALTRTKAEDPLTLQEAIMKRDGSIFPVSQLMDRINQIENNTSEFDDVYVGDLVQGTGGVVEYRMSAEQPIRFFPHKDNKLQGAIEFFTMPEKDRNGKVFPNRYYGGCDPYDDDSSETMSLGSILIWDSWTDKIVAEYTGRPMYAEDFYEICRLLCIFYDARLNYENNKKGLFSWFSRKNCLYLLTDTLEFLRDKQLVKETYFGNKSKGTNATQPINNYARMLIRNWLIKPVAMIQNIDGQDVETSVPNLVHIRNLALLYELSQWNYDGNFDRVSALGMLMLLREDVMRLCNGDSEQMKRSYIPDDYAGNDEFFRKNWFDRKGPAIGS